MDILCILAKEKIEVPVNKDIHNLLEALTDASVPFYILNGKRVEVKVNCDIESINYAKSNTLSVYVYKKYYEVVCTWWAGKAVIKTCETEDEAWRCISTKRQTYRGNGHITIEEQKATKEFKVNKDVLKNIIQQCDGVHNKMCFQWC